MQIYKLFFNSFVPDANLTQRQIPEKEKQDVKENASNHCKMSFEKIPAKSWNQKLRHAKSMPGRSENLVLDGQKKTFLPLFDAFRVRERLSFVVQTVTSCNAKGGL